MFFNSDKQVENKWVKLTGQFQPHEKSVRIVKGYDKQ